MNVIGITGKSGSGKKHLLPFLDRKKMGDIVFTQKHKMKELSVLIWEFMQQQLDSILAQDDETIVLEWILLPHSRYWKKCNCKILVTSDDARRKTK